MKWFLFALAMALIHPATVEARPACTDAAHVETFLADSYSEHPIAMGLSREGVVIEVFATDDGRTWTLIVVRPDGIACYLTSGAAWQTISKPQEGTSANGRSG